MEQEAVERLAVKTPEEAIIERIGRDFNLAPFMARTQFGQMRRYFEEYLGLVELVTARYNSFTVSVERPIVTLW